MKTLGIDLIKITVTYLANSCATPLFRRPQGSQGCLEKQNHPLSLNLVNWCAKIGSKTKKVWKTTELIKNMSKMMVFWQVFGSFLVLGPILAHQTTKFKLSGYFCFSRHPWEPWGRLNSGVICIWIIFQLFCGCWRHLAKKFVFLQIEAWCNFTLI